MMLLLFLGYMFFPQVSFAKDLGVMGEIYPINEPDFLEFIQSRVQAMEKSTQWNQLKNTMQERAERYRDRPTVVTGIQRATQTRSWFFDPSIVLDHDVRTPDGTLIAISGTRVNPLVRISLSKTLIFYDADDVAEVKWATALDKKLKGHDKLILVNGSMLGQEKRFSKPIYFDQAGRLTTHFGIHYVPAIIEQSGLSLKITEVRL